MTWYPATVTVEATEEPVTIEEARAQCRIIGSDEDTLLTGLIASARSHVESYCGTPLVSREVAVKCDSFCDFASFPVVPVQSVTVAYLDTAGDAATLSTSVYELRSDGLVASIALKNGQSWPSIQTGSRITVTATAGYASVPPAIKHAVLLLISQWYDNRSASSDKPMAEIPHAVTALLSNHRSFAF